MGQPSTSRNSEDAGDEAAAKRARTSSMSSTGATQGTEGQAGSSADGGEQVEAIASKHRHRKTVQWDTWKEDQEKFRKQINRAQHLEVMEQVRSMLGCSYDLAEVYSPPRVAKKATDLGMKGGFSLDFSHPDPNGYIWDFDQHECRKKAMQLI